MQGGPALLIARPGVVMGVDRVRTMRGRASAVAAAVVLAVAGAVGVSFAAAKPTTPTYRGMPCPDPVGHRVTQCRLGVHGTPDLSRRSWAKLFQREVTVSVAFSELAGNPEAGGRREWPLRDSLGLPMGTLTQSDAGKVRIAAADGTSYSVVAMNMRGHGCAADPAQMAGSALVQLIAPKAPSHGTQAFLDVRALGAGAAADAFATELGGGSGCGPSNGARGKARPLRDPAVGATAHARLSNGKVNTVTEYDAKPVFGGTVYFMSNTTSVFVGGVARGMVRVGTPISTVDRFKGCDPNSDGTLTWRYVAIHTGRRSRPRLYGWIPARCHGRAAIAARAGREAWS